MNAPSGPGTFKHVFFDFDGVLCDSLPACVEEYERLRAERFGRLPPVSLESRLDLPFAGALRTALLPWISEEDSRLFFDAHSAAMLQRSATLAAFPEIPDLLRSMPPRSCSIVSSAYNDAIVGILTGVGLSELPPAVAFLKGRDTRETKTEKIQSVLSDLGLAPSEAIYVGDLESDLLYCLAVPIACILVTYGYQTPAHLKRLVPDVYTLVDSPTALTATLTRILNPGD